MLLVAAPTNDKRGPSSVRRTLLEPFQRRHWGNFREMGWSAYGCFRAHRYHVELNWAGESVTLSYDVAQASYLLMHCCGVRPGRAVSLKRLSPSVTAPLSTLSSAILPLPTLASETLIVTVWREAFAHASGCPTLPFVETRCATAVSLFRTSIFVFSLAMNTRSSFQLQWAEPQEQL